MPDQIKKLLKRTESQDVSDDGQHPHLMTGKFENKGFDVLSDDDSKQQTGIHNFQDNMVSPVNRNIDALEMMNDYNSSQIMLLVN